MLDLKEKDELATYKDGWCNVWVLKRGKICHGEMIFATSKEAYDRALYCLNWAREYGSLRTQEGIWPLSELTGVHMQIPVGEQ